MKYIISWRNPIGQPETTSISGRQEGDIIVVEQSDTSFYIDKISRYKELEWNTKVYLYPVKDNHNIKEIYSDQTLHGQIISLDPLKIQLEFKREALVDHLNLIDVIQRRVPDANEFMSKYNENLSYKVLESIRSAELVTNVGGVMLASKIDITKINNIFQFTIAHDDMLKYHLEYTTTGLITFDHIDKNFQIQVYIKQISNNDKLVKKQLQPVSFQIIPQTLSYGKRTNLETYKYENNIRQIQQIGQQLGKKTKYWIRILRINQYAITLVSILLALFVANDTLRENFIVGLLLIFFGTLFIQSGGNLLNDYFDYKSESDEINISNNFEIHRNFIQYKLLHPTLALSLGIALFAIGAIIGLYLNYITPGNYVLILGIIGAIITYFYTGPPLKLVYRGIGEVVLALNFGPFIIIGSVLVLSNGFPSTQEIILITLPSLVFIYNFFILNELGDIEADKVINKKTTTVRLGSEKSGLLYIFCLTFIVLFTIFYDLVGYYNLGIINYGLLVISMIIATYSLGQVWIKNPKSFNYYILSYFLWSLSIILSN